MLEKERKLAIRMGSYNSNQIKHAEFNYGYITGDTFKPGGTVAGSGKIVLTSIVTTFKKLNKVKPEIGLLVGTSYEWVSMGNYYIRDIKIDRNRNTTELELMDGMYRLNQPYVSDLVYPAQIRDVIREICTKTGVELETDDLGFRAIQHHIQAKAEKKDITFREVLSQAVQLLGYSAFFNRKGKLEIRGLTDSGLTITADNYFLHGLTKSEVEYQIAGITCKKDKETLTVGLRTGRSLELENSFMTRNLLDDLYADLKEIKYYPFSLNWQGHLKLEVGQWVTLVTNKNETYKVPVLTQSFSFSGGLKSKIGADSKSGSDTQYAYKGSLFKKIEQFSTDLEAEIQQQIEYADQKFEAQKEEFESQLATVLSQAEANARVYADNVRQEISAKVAEVTSKATANELLINQKTAEALAQAGAAESLAQEAQRIGNQAKLDATQAKSQLNQVKSEVDEVNRQILQRVTRTEFDPINQRLTNAETSIRTQAGQIEQRLTSTQVGQLIEGKGYQTASQVQSVVTQTADSLTRTISQVEAKIPTEIGSRNYVRGSFDMKKGTGNWNEGTFRHSGPGSSVTVDISDFPRGYVSKAIKLSGQGAGIAQDAFYVDAGPWTISYWVKGTSGTRVRLQAYWSANNGRTGVSPSITLSGAGGWERISYSVNNLISGMHNIAYIYLESGAELLVTAPKLEQGKILTDHSPAPEDLVQVVAFNEVKDTVSAHTRTIAEQGQSISQAVQTAQGLVSRVSVLMDAQNLVYDPTRYSKHIPRNSTSNLQLAAYSLYSGMRISASGLAGDTYSGFRLPLRTSTFAKGEKLSLRAVIGIDALPDSGGQIKFEIKNQGNIIAYFWLNPTRTGNNQIFTATTTVNISTTAIDEYGLDVLINRNGNVNITQISIVRGDQIPSTFVDSTTAQDLAISTQVSQLAGSYAIQNISSAGDLINGINFGADGNNRLSGKATHITGETLIDNAVIKSAMVDKLKTANFESGSVTAIVIGAEAVTADKLKVDQALFNKLSANEAYLRQLFAKNAFITSVQAVTMSATKIVGGVLKSTNNATNFNLQTGWIDMNAESVGIRNLWPNYPIQYLVFGRGAINGKSASYTALMSNSKRAIGMNDGSAGIQIWNAMDNTTAVNLYGDEIAFMYNASDKRGVNLNVVTNVLSGIEDIHIKGKSLVAVLNTIFDNFRNLDHDGNYQRGYYATW